MQRLKTVQRREFTVVFAGEWEPVVLEGDALPEFARAIPDTVRCRLIASGQELAGVPYAHDRLRDALLVGGIDLWRHSPDDPVAFNKDWYAVLSSASSPELLYIDGPQRDSEHWSDEIPSRYNVARVIDIQGPEKD